MKAKNPVILIIRDGWGYNPKREFNYIKQAKTPNEDRYLKTYSHTLLKASGEAVGLEKGYQGNSEVGHLTLGSGRIIFQSLPRINQSIKSGEFFKKKEFLDLIKHCREKKSKLHLMGLLQVEGVHSHLDHLLALLDLCAQNKFKDVLIHLITDGRDAPVNDSLKHLNRLQRKIKELNLGEIVSVSGRYYAMDRDNRWSRTKTAYKIIVQGEGPSFKDIKTEIKACHLAGQSDEFIIPKKLESYQGAQSQDAFIFFNFRTDRTRQLSQAIVEKNFKGFSRPKKTFKMTAMTQYYDNMSAQVAFPSIDINNTLSDILAQANYRQLRISETEKYAHVTFFFNGQKEKANRGEDRILIPSPKVATYDLQPEMSVFKISDRLTKEIKKRYYDFIVVNLVNGDMVGHTAQVEAIKKAISAVDKAQGDIVKSALENGYTTLLLADHGNAEDKRPATITSHTTNPVPAILISPNKSLKLRKGGGLSDVAPTILELLGLEPSVEMTGQSLLFNY